MKFYIRHILLLMVPIAIIMRVVLVHSDPDAIGFDPSAFAAGIMVPWDLLAYAFMGGEEVKPIEIKNVLDAVVVMIGFIISLSCQVLVGMLLIALYIKAWLAKDWEDFKLQTRRLTRWE